MSFLSAVVKPYFILLQSQQTDGLIKHNGVTAKVMINDDNSRLAPIFFFPVPVNRCFMPVECLRFIWFYSQEAEMDRDPVMHVFKEKRQGGFQNKAASSVRFRNQGGKNKFSVRFTPNSEANVEGFGLQGHCRTEGCRKPLCLCGQTRTFHSKTKRKKKNRISVL